MNVPVVFGMSGSSDSSGDKQDVAISMPIITGVDSTRIMAILALLGTVSLQRT